MKLKNIVIVVNDIEKSKEFYHTMFGLMTLLDTPGNVILSQGLVLQEKEIWKQEIGLDVTPENHASILYFEESDLDAFVEKLNKTYPKIEYVTPLTTLDWGQKLVRFYDLDGNLIEVRTPIR